MTTEHIDTTRHPIVDADFIEQCRRQLDSSGVLVLPGFFTPAAVQRAVTESEHREHEAF